MPTGNPTQPVDEHSTTTASKRSHISLPWMAVVCIMIAFIWGNSLVPGEGSGALSSSVTTWLHGGLEFLGIPSAWLTEHIVRKTAHFSEYLVLALFTMQAMRPHRASPDTRTMRIVVTVLTLVLVPSCDETIQRFVSGRSGQVTDVLIDCSGALAGVLLTLLCSRIFGALRKRG